MNDQDRRAVDKEESHCDSSMQNYRLRGQMTS